MPAVDSVKRVVPPLGPAYLAAALRGRCEVEILDTVMEGFESEERYSESVVRIGLCADAIAERIVKSAPEYGAECTEKAVPQNNRDTINRI